MSRRIAIAAALLIGGLVALAPAAAACGFLVAPNGAVQLLRTSTLVAWDGQVERYVTNFEFAGPEQSFGSIIPLPAVPTDVRRAGDWTLQRLAQEVAPAVESPTADVEAAGAGADVTVLLETRVGSLDITVLEGGGSEVAGWANDNGFQLGEGAGELLDFYSDRSPIFLAARFDALAAAADGFGAGDGIPILVEMPTDRPWVPLHILAFDKPAAEVVKADVFLLTPDRPELVHGRGLELRRSEAASGVLLDDLRSDDNMEWVPQSAWFSYLDLEVPAGDLVYDLSVGADGTAPSLKEAGLTRFDLGAADLEGFGFVTESDDGPAWWTLTLAGLALAVAGGLVGAAAGGRLAPVPPRR
jgi:Uncharacterized protein conserved in bacteria (DUF2330)